MQDFLGAVTGQVSLLCFLIAVAPTLLDYEDSADEMKSVIWRETAARTELHVVQERVPTLSEGNSSHGPRRDLDADQQSRYYRDPLLFPLFTYPQAILLHRRSASLGIAAGIAHAACQLLPAEILFSVKRNNFVGTSSSPTSGGADDANASGVMKLSLMSPTTARRFTTGRLISQRNSLPSQTPQDHVNPLAQPGDSSSPRVPAFFDSATTAIISTLTDFTPTPWSLGHGFGALALFVILCNGVLGWFRRRHGVYRWFLLLHRASWTLILIFLAAHTLSVAMVCFALLAWRCFLKRSKPEVRFRVREVARLSDGSHMVRVLLSREVEVLGEGNENFIAVPPGGFVMVRSAAPTGDGRPARGRLSIPTTDVAHPFSVCGISRTQILQTSRVLEESRGPAATQGQDQEQQRKVEHCAAAEGALRPENTKQDGPAASAPAVDDEAPASRNIQLVRETLSLLVKDEPESSTVGASMTFSSGGRTTSATTVVRDVDNTWTRRNLLQEGRDVLVAGGYYGNLMLPRVRDESPSGLFHPTEASAPDCNTSSKFDSVVLIAGGLGITPMLSCLERFANINRSSCASFSRSCSVDVDLLLLKQQNLSLIWLTREPLEEDAWRKLNAWHPQLETVPKLYVYQTGAARTGPQQEAASGRCRSVHESEVLAAFPHSGVPQLYRTSNRVQFCAGRPTAEDWQAMFLETQDHVEGTSQERATTAATTTSSNNVAFNSMGNKQRKVLICLCGPEAMISNVTSRVSWRLRAKPLSQFARNCFTGRRTNEGEQDKPRCWSS
ncbi:unnamed protein product [Amoebophrya sp. A120]|nr:unnamed protein product [Amoebophrya sp. A120]|eukprot:GSA120T00020052001.1